MSRNDTLDQVTSKITCQTRLGHDRDCQPRQDLEALACRQMEHGHLLAFQRRQHQINRHKIRES
jgi:hypothetical protein